MTSIDWERLGDDLDSVCGRWWVKSHEGRYLAVGEEFAQRLGSVGWRMAESSDTDFWSEKDTAQFRVEDRRVLARGCPVVVPEFHPQERFLVTVKVPVTSSWAPERAVLGVTFSKVTPTLWRLQAGDRLNVVVSSLVAACSSEPGPTTRLGTELYHRPLRSPSLPEWVRDERSILEAEFQRPPSLTDLGRWFRRSPTHVGRAFLKGFGTSPQRFVRARRIEFVAVRLTTTSTPIGQLAYEAGFTDQSHLGKAFKAELGTTPAAYRAEFT